MPFFIKHKKKKRNEAGRHSLFTGEEREEAPSFEGTARGIGKEGERIIMSPRKEKKRAASKRGGLFLKSEQRKRVRHTNRVWWGTDQERKKIGFRYHASVKKKELKIPSRRIGDDLVSLCDARGKRANKLFREEGWTNKTRGKMSSPSTPGLGIDS